jgi:hypothetical protein
MFRESKSTNTLRVFVFGESAAYGDPQPKFGLPRMLEVLLRERFADKRIEVINVAMTAINSHVVLPIARECARLNGDLWVVYMGNNEAVGPFGPATVFGKQAPPLWLVRTTIALKRSRVVQLLEFGLQRLRGSSSSPRVFGGMEMFADNKLRADDRRLTRLYSHFERNLRDIIDVGANGGAQVFVCTVASNTRDCAPFASLHSATISKEREKQWNDLFAAGIAATQRGERAIALSNFTQAAKFDDEHAEMVFRRAQIQLALGNTNEAAVLFTRARDLDAVRFRTDTKLNEITRRVAARDPERVRLLDIEKGMSAAGNSHALGDEFFLRARPFQSGWKLFCGDEHRARDCAHERERAALRAVGVERLETARGD